MAKIITGNIFTTAAQTIVNTVNCVGVMGAGLALECRLRYPEMFKRYAVICENKQLDVGMLWLYKAPERWILNFPTKRHWKDPSLESYLHLGLRKFVETYRDQGIASIAFPLLGAQSGGLDSDRVEQIMLDYLEDVVIPVEIYRYDPKAPDDMFQAFRESLLGMGVEAFRRKSGMRPQELRLLFEALEEPRFCQLNQLGAVKGIGIKTLEKAFAFAQGGGATQQDLGF